MFARNRCRLMLLAWLLPGAALLSPTTVLALGLGDIHLKSALDAPLSADIDVVDADSDDLSTLKATLAPRDTFSQLGADYPAFLGTLTFKPEKTADGRTVIHVTSSAVADEPFATLLVEADWSRGHVIREYTVLFNPPVFNSNAASNTAVAAPTVDNGAQTGTIAPAASAAAPSAAAAPAQSAASASGEQAAGAAAPAAGEQSAPAGSEQAGSAESASAQSASAQSAQSSAQGSSAQSGSAQGSQQGAEAGAAPGAGGGANGLSAGGSYTVQKGDTLSLIAAQAYGAHDRRARDRALVAIYRANPRAFGRKNMNDLQAGSVLMLPGDSELIAIGPGEAATEVRQQYDAWRDERGGSVAESAATGGGAAGQLRLVTPQEGAQQAGTQSAPSSPSSQESSAPAAGVGAGAGAGAGGTNSALRRQVQQLQAQLAQSQRLLQLRDAQLAAMQARVAQQANAGASAGTAAATAPPPAVSPAPPVSPPVAAPSAPSAQSAAPPITTAPPAPPAHARPAPVRRPVTAARPRAAEPGNSMLDLVLEYWYVPAGLLAILIALLVLKVVRTRQEDAFDRSLGRLSTPALEPAPAKPTRGDTVPVRTMTSKEEPAYRVEETGSHQQPTFDEPIAATEATGQHVAIDEGMTGEVPVALDQGDPLAEADFHMAYGLYDQAAELVQGAIAREPQRRDLKLKLLEVFFVWGNRDRFLQSAHELAATRSQAPAGEWEKIVIMGRQIAPEDPLFADARGISGAASAGVDLNLEGGQNRVDFDLLGEPSLGAANKDAGVDLDLGTALGETDADRTQDQIGEADPTSEATKLDSSVDFVVDEGELASDATGHTRKMPGSASGAAITREMPAMPNAARGMGDTERVPLASAASADAPTVEQPQLRRDEGATIRQKLDAAMRHGAAATDQTAELAIDDLGLDLGSLESHEEVRAVANSPDAPTMLAEVHQDARQSLARADAERADTGATQTTRVGPAGPMRATGTWMFTDTDFASMAAGKAAAPAEVTQQAKTELITQIAAQPPIDTSSTSRLAALDSADLDLDLSNLESLNEQPANGLDLDVGTPSGGDTTYIKTRKLSPAELPGGAAATAETADAEALPDLEPVTLSEVGTKLDLARAYMDMGDPEGARSILSEVLSEGSLSQKQEARRLMDALPG
ncbi:MAG TPA: FimV/HubP family polar landmark protein [Steroidobacteraceae bacterium]|nr:FimV/HubP family polar landmark protein [Steroidobacteraceae bacterium]